MEPPVLQITEIKPKAKRGRKPGSAKKKIPEQPTFNIVQQLITIKFD